MKSIAELLGGTRYENEFKVGENHTVVLQSLYKSEEIEVLKKVQGYDFYSQIEASKIPVLARSIVSIDKVPIQAYPDFQSEFNKHKDGKVDTAAVCEKMLGEMDAGLIDYLFSLYLQLKDLREKDRAKLLGFTQGLKDGPSSSSADSLENGQKS